MSESGRVVLHRKTGQRLIMSYASERAEDQVVIAVITVVEAGNGFSRISVEADKRIRVARNELVGIPDLEESR